MTDCALPPDAVRAAERAFHELALKTPCPSDAEFVAAVLSAAAPAIAAGAEYRERFACAQLAEQQRFFHFADMIRRRGNG